LNLAAVVELQLPPEQSVKIVSRQDMANVVVATLTAIVHKMVIECYTRMTIMHEFSSLKIYLNSYCWYLFSLSLDIL
jgi:hypothetical protein